MKRIPVPGWLMAGVLRNRTKSFIASYDRCALAELAGEYQVPINMDQFLVWAAHVNRVAKAPMVSMFLVALLMRGGLNADCLTTNADSRVDYMPDIATAKRDLGGPDISATTTSLVAVVVHAGLSGASGGAKPRKAELKLLEKVGLNLGELEGKFKNYYEMLLKGIPLSVVAVLSAFAIGSPEQLEEYSTAIGAF
eukprot:3058594-Amphidinium_carterae.1